MLNVNLTTLIHIHFFENGLDFLVGNQEDDDGNVLLDLMLIKVAGVINVNLLENLYHLPMEIVSYPLQRQPVELVFNAIK